MAETSRNGIGEKTRAGPGRLSLALAIVGGGRACKFILELLQHDTFPFLDIRILGVCDVNPRAEGLLLAREMGIYTTENFEDLFTLDGLDGIIELTGNRQVLLDLIKLRPRGVGVLEHNIGRLLRTMFAIDQRLKSAERQIMLEQTISDFLIQQARQRIVVLGPDCMVLDANEPYLRGLSLPKEEVVGRPCHEILHGLDTPCPESSLNLDCPVMETLRSGRTSHAFLQFPVNSETSVWCDMVTHPVKGAEGDIARVIAICKDVTEEFANRWEERVKKLKDDMKKLIQEDRMISLGKLVASCVHELNNPIQGMLTFCGLMQDVMSQDDPDPVQLAKFSHYLSLMAAELQRCGCIVSGLLSFSRESAVEFKIMDLNDVLQSVVRLTRHKMELQDIYLDVRLHPGPIFIRGDAGHLQQCVLNMVFNAIEAMPGGGRLTLSSHRDSAAGKALVEVADTGLGIDEEHMQHIFDPFFTTKQEGEGTGLGLSIVYGVAKNHGGEVSVESAMGRGSVFTLTFPLRE